VTEIPPPEFKMRELPRSPFYYDREDDNVIVLNAAAGRRWMPIENVSTTWRHAVFDGLGFWSCVAVAFTAGLIIGTVVGGVFNVV
jgi:hypothetical protein